MAFADPQSITIDSIAHSLARTSVDGESSSYQESGADATYTLVVSHSHGKRTRRAYRLTVDTVVPNYLIDGSFVPASASITLVADIPNGGVIPVTEQKNLIDGLLAHLSASSGAQVTKFLNNES